jgi:hypothetical protein
MNNLINTSNYFYFGVQLKGEKIKRIKNGKPRKLEEKKLSESSSKSVQPPQIKKQFESFYSKNDFMLSTKD